MPYQRSVLAFVVGISLAVATVSGSFVENSSAQAPAPHPAQAPASHNESPNAATSKPVDAPPTEALRKTVVYLTTVYQDGDSEKSIQGTAFFVLFRDAAWPPNFGFPYLVTNRHMIEPRDDGGKPYSVRGFRVRINMRNPDGSDRAVEDWLPNVQWSFPTDDAIDLAACPFLIDQTKFDIDVIPTEFFETPDKFQHDGVSEGSSISFTGFFYQVPGQSKIHPIVRQGTLAMLSDEKMDTTLHGLGLLYLADMHVFGGNSGSPAFVDLAGFQSSFIRLGGFPYRLLGVVSGYIEEASDGSFTSVVSRANSTKTNSGVSTIVPAQQLLDLLNSTELLQLRQTYLKDHPAPAMQPKS